MNCPNCGAPITGRVCEYCGTIHAKKAEQVRVEVERDYTDLISWNSMEVFRVYHEPEVKVLYPTVKPDGFCAWGERKENHAD